MGPSGSYGGKGGGTCATPLAVTGLSRIIAAVAIGVRVGAVSEAVAAAVILVAVFTWASSPVLFTKVYRGEDVPARA